MLSLISNFLHCDPSVMQGLGAVKDARFGLTGWRVDKVVVGGVLGIDGMPLIPYENYYTQRMVAGTFELNVFPIYEIDWDRRQVTVIYDAQATGDDAYDELEQPHSDTNIFPTLFGKVNGRKVSLLINTVTPGGVVLKGSDEFMAMARAAPRHRENLGRDGEFGGYTFVADSVELGPAKAPNAIVNVAPGPRLPWVGESHGRPAPWVDGYIGFDMAKRLNLFVNARNGDFLGKPSAFVNDMHMDDRAGLNLYANGEYYKVGEIDPRGPAAKAGIRNGDWITDYKGPRGMAGLPWAFTQKPGTAVTFDVERVAGRPFKVTVVTEERV